MSKVLLYSGGTDSWIIDKIWKPNIKLYINIHGRYSKQEINKLPNDVKIIDIPFLGSIEEDDAYIPLRNLYFLMIASNFGDEICLGATLGDRGGKDKTPKFLEKTQDIFNYCLTGNSNNYNKNIIINTDFINRHKYSLIEEYISKGGSIEEYIESTFSCHHPINNKECGHCKPCYKKFLTGYYFGYKYSETDKLNMIDYLKDNVIPKSSTGGTYFNKREGEGKYAEEAVDRLFKEYNLNWRDYQ